MNKKLQNIVDSLPVIRQLYNDNAYITVIDSKGILMAYEIPRGVQAQLSVGEKFDDPTGGFDTVIRTGVKKHNFLPKEVMGEAFEGDLIPIKDGADVVGCFICTYPAGDKEYMTDITTKFQDSVNNVSESVKLVVDILDKLVATLSDMEEKTTGIEEDVNTATKVVGKISSNAGRSNILALNASIEAARSGESGKGFAVVATEMGKLAKDSGSSAGEIKSTLNVIANHLSTIVTSISSANELAKEHMETISGITATLEETLELANELKNSIGK